MGRSTGRRAALQSRAPLVVILLVAAALRVVGARYGFPLLVHPDEWAVVDAVIEMARRNSFEPPWSLRPDHVEMKLDYVVFAGYAALFKGTSIEAAFAADPVPFYWMARLVTAAFGVASVGLAYLVGVRWSRRVGLVAATLFALFPPFVQHAHYATPDVPLTFALMLMIYALMRYVDSCSWASLLWASFAVALAIGIKYPGAVGTVMIGLIVVLTAVRDRAWLRLVAHGAGAAAATAGFLFVISPTLFTNFSGVRRELEIQAEGGRLGNPDLGLFGNMRYYVSGYVHVSGVILALLAVVGLVVVVRRRRLDVIPWFTGLLVWGSLSALPMTWERWGLPMWVTPLLLGAVGFCALLEKLTSRRTRWIPLAIGGVLVLQLASGAARAVASLLAPDTREAALAWAKEEGVNPSNSIYEGYTPFLPGAPALFFRQVQSDGNGYLLLTSNGDPATYVVMSSSMYDRVIGNPAYREEEQIYQYVFDTHEEIATFQPADRPQSSMLEPVSIVRNLRFVHAVATGEMSGPVIRVFESPSPPTPGD